MDFLNRVREFIDFAKTEPIYLCDGQISYPRFKYKCKKFFPLDEVKVDLYI